MLHVLCMTLIVQLVGLHLCVFSLYNIVDGRMKNMKGAVFLPLASTIIITIIIAIIIIIIIIITILILLLVSRVLQLISEFLPLISSVSPPHPSPPPPRLPSPQLGSSSGNGRNLVELSIVGRLPGLRRLPSPTPSS